MANHYATLGLEKTASDEDIKSAYRKLAVMYHPDKNPGNKSAEDKFKEVTEAYEVLKDPNKRSQYDQFGSSSFNGADPFGVYHRRSSPFGGAYRRHGGSPFSSEFSFNLDDFLRGFHNMNERNNAPKKTKGQDLNIYLDLTLDECYTGTSKQIKYKHTGKCDICKGFKTIPGTSNTCPDCSSSGRSHNHHLCDNCKGVGTVGSCTNCNSEGIAEITTSIKIDVPAGVANGNNLQLSEHGNAGTNGGPSGDLYVYIKEIPHDTIKRSGSDLHIEMPMTMTEAAFGVKITVQLLAGEVFKYTIEDGAQSGTIETISGKGMPIPGRNKRGDLHIIRRIVVPENLSPEMKDIFEQLQKLEKSDENEKNHKDE